MQQNVPFCVHFCTSVNKKQKIIRLLCSWTLEVGSVGCTKFLGLKFQGMVGKCQMIACITAFLCRRTSQFFNRWTHRQQVNNGHHWGSQLRVGPQQPWGNHHVWMASKPPVPLKICNWRWIVTNHILPGEDFSPLQQMQRHFHKCRRGCTSHMSHLAQKPLSHNNTEPLQWRRPESGGSAVWVLEAGQHMLCLRILLPIPLGETMRTCSSRDSGDFV